jgi:hypothetical protein
VVVVEVRLFVSRLELLKVEVGVSGPGRRRVVLLICKSKLCRNCESKVFYFGVVRGYHG